MAKPVINRPELLPGLSGNSWLLHQSQQRVLRATPQQPLPFINRQREYRILKKLRHTTIAPTPYTYHQGELTVEWITGETLSATHFVPTNDELIELLMALHRRPLFGYRLQLYPLLVHYWQHSACHRVNWLRKLQRLKSRGEPRPLRLVPLHMDIHPGNIIATAEGIRLIDWEYAADGDIALELAGLTLQNPLQAAEWVSVYSERFHLNPKQLTQQVALWTPWLQLLQASWYQLKAEQTQQPIYKQLADEIWRQI